MSGIGRKVRWLGLAALVAMATVQAAHAAEEEGPGPARARYRPYLSWPVQRPDWSRAGGGYGWYGPGSGGYTWGGAYQGWYGPGLGWYGPSEWW
jgi:hypothetical protein